MKEKRSLFWHHYKFFFYYFSIILDTPAPCIFSLDHIKKKYIYV